MTPLGDRREAGMRFCAAVLAATCLLSASCATSPPDERAHADALGARVAAVLARRGLGPDALQVIDNVVRHEAPAPPYAPPIVRELLARPLAAADAAAFFERSVPAELRRLAEDVQAAPARIDGPPIPIRDLLEVYLGVLAEAQRVLRSATRGASIDPEPILRELDRRLPSTGRLVAVAQAVDPATVERATGLFLAATARFVRALRAAAGRIRFPDKPMRFESEVGVVSIGTTGDDRHGPDAAVIVDPGGNDLYERSPASGGAISVIVDLGGDDRYLGSDLAVHALSAIVDFAGNDRYAMAGPGLGAAIAGASVIVDFAGDDSYEAALFGEAAAAFGLGAIVDLGGDDRYRIRAGGQGLGMTAGVGVLWDRGGNDAYIASGLADAFDRGGGVSMAQGAGLGGRARIGGGIGILRDDGGDDVYEAQMFAQGVAYYYGAGLLWDGGGDDRYRAVRYAQGNGVHEAVGILRDESGNDHYELGFGVGQGMGLDLSVGLLFDGAGDDRYQAQVLAQGAATANGIGILIDSGGADRWRMGADQRVWGQAEWSRGLPSLGILIYDPAGAVFEREGKTVPPTPESAALGGPAGGAAIAHEPPHVPACPAVVPAAGDDAVPLGEVLRQLLPGFIDGKADPRTFADVRRRLTTRLRPSIAELPRGDFDVSYSLGEALRCSAVGAADDDAAQMWDEIERQLAEDPATPFLGPFVVALRARPAPAPQMQRILRVLDAHPRCGVRSTALALRDSAAPGDGSLAPAAQAALRSSCWRLQAQAIAVLNRLGVAPDADADLPSFLH